MPINTDVSVKPLYGDTTPPRGNVNAAGKKELSPDDFMRLFVEQMKHQNPLQPQDSNVILQQMAEISSLSASKDMQNTLNKFEKNFNASLQTSEVLQATQLVGRKVEIPAGVSPLTSTGLQGSVLVSQPSSDVVVKIMDKDGNLVKTIDLGAAGSTGLMDFKWDGLKEDGTTHYDEGFYKISASSIVNGKEMSQDTAGSYQVNSVALDPQAGVILNLEGIGGRLMGDIIKIL